jgi:hypothetical protein
MCAKYWFTKDNDSRTPLLHFPTIFNFFFRSLQVLYVHNALFTSILCFWNFISPIIYIIRVLTEGTVLTKWRLLRELPRFNSLVSLQRQQFWHKMASVERLFVSTCFSRNNIAICWSATQLRRICILHYKTKVVLLVWQS